MPPNLRRALGAVCAVALFSLTLAGREKIVAKVSGADRVFAALGFSVNLTGVEFRNVVSRVSDIDGRKVLAVSGEVVNVRRFDSATLAPLKLTVRAADGRALYVWTAEALKSKLAPGESASFRTRLAAPPEDGRDVAVTLSESVRQAASPRREAQVDMMKHADMAKRMVR